METLLQGILPRLMKDVSFAIYPFQCKQELLLRLPARLKGYRRWLPPAHRIVVVVDLDGDDCSKLKEELEGFAVQAGLSTRHASSGGSFAVVNRIAIEELEAWYFGDWRAICSAYPKVPVTIPQRASYRDSDAIRGGTWEALERILKTAGYFQTGLRKLELARAVAPHMDPDRNSSSSFQCLLKAILEMSEN